LQSEKLAAVGRLASSIAHEINNPLESVMNLIYLARLTAIHPDTQRYLETADQEVRRISIIANQTLRFHKQPSNPQPISAAELYATVLGIYEGRLRNSGITVEQRLRTGRPTVCFEGDIRQVLNNLIGNAIDAMPCGGRLLVRSREGTHWPTGRNGLILTVADTGEGMTPEILTKIFDPFFTTKGIGGTGLGLWVSQEIVLRHEGALRVRSTRREGRSGTAFALFLPFDVQA
jgi:signal transduction histidine kinase